MTRTLASAGLAAMTTWTAGCFSSGTVVAGPDASFMEDSPYGDVTTSPDVTTGDDAAAVPDATSPSEAGLDAADAGVPAAPDFVWYVLDETSGTTARDSSPHHYDITNLTGVTWASGATFDGTGGGGSVVVDPSYRTPPLTITAWLTPALRTDGTIPFGVLQPYPPNAFSNDQPGLYGYGVGVNVWSLADAGSASALAAEGVGPCQPPANPPQTCDVAALVDAGVTFMAGQEVFVALTVSPLDADGGAAVANVYVNGTLLGGSSSVAVQTSGPTTLYLGVHNTDTGYGTRRFFDGRIRDVRAYKQTLSVSQLAALYASGPTTVAPPAPDL